MLPPNPKINEDKSQEILVPKVVPKRHECKELNTLYLVKCGEDVDSFIYNYESDGQVFVLRLDLLSESNKKADEYAVFLSTVNFGYADLQGMNVFRYVNNLKKILLAMIKIGKPVKKLYFGHSYAFYTKSQIEEVQIYLRRKGVKNVEDQPIEGLIAKFLHEYNKDLSKETVLDGIFNLFRNENFNENSNNAKEKRYELFSKVIARAFRKEIATGQVKLDLSLKPHFTLEFLDN